MILQIEKKVGVELKCPQVGFGKIIKHLLSKSQTSLEKIYFLTNSKPILCINVI